MQNLQIENLTTEELKSIITEVIRTEFQNNLTDQKEETAEYLTRKQVAEILQVSNVTLWNWENEGLLKSYRIGNQVRYKREEVENSLQDLKEQKNKKRK